MATNVPGTALPVTAMILAAGAGIRLRPLTDHMPKCMVRLNGRPLLEYTLAHLARSGICDIIINLSHAPEAVTGYFGDGAAWGVRIRYSYEPTSLGTAGGVRQARQTLAGENATFLVWYGDNLSRCNLQQMYQMHRDRGATATIALFEREDVSASGIVGLDAGGRIERFLEKPGPGQAFSHWINAGIYLLAPAALDAIPAEGRPDFGRHIFPALLARPECRLQGYCLSRAEGLWWVDTPADLARTQAELAAPAIATDRPG